MPNNEETEKEKTNRLIKENQLLREKLIKLENQLAKEKAMKLVREAKAELEKKKQEKNKGNC